MRDNCPSKARNLHCDEECNKYACDFDGQDCSLGMNPWRNCSVLRCWEKFSDKVCDPECNSAECLFDGRDCEKKLRQCNPVDNNFCERHYGDGSCDQGCNNEECDWDGMDCEKLPPSLASGIMSVVVRNTDVQTFLASRSLFLRYLGHQLRATFRIKQSPLGNPMVFPWDTSVDPALLIIDGSDPSQTYSTSLSGVLVFLQLDNRKCSEGNVSSSCFATAIEAAEFLAASAARHSLDSEFDIVQVRGHSGTLPEEEETKPSWLAYLLFTTFTVAMIGLLFIVLFAQKRKAKGITWFPDGFRRHTNSSTRRSRSRRHGPGN